LWGANRSPLPRRARVAKRFEHQPWRNLCIREHLHRNAKARPSPPTRNLAKHRIADPSRPSRSSCATLDTLDENIQIKLDFVELNCEVSIRGSGRVPINLIVEIIQ